MKTPEEIKKGLECCGKKADTCDGCPYEIEFSAECLDDMHEDALAYIRQLERDKAWAGENYDLMREELAQVQRERDAAIRDCARFPCYTCNERENGDFCTHCRTTGTFRHLHEWRGPCEENGGLPEPPEEE